MNNNEKLLLATACFFGGMVAGFLIAPIKKGIYCGNNSANNVRSENELKDILDKDIQSIKI